MILHMLQITEQTGFTLALQQLLQQIHPQTIAAWACRSAQSSAGSRAGPPPPQTGDP